MRIAFISSAYRTVFFHELETGLAARGHDVFWICPGGRWARWLTQRGVDPARVLDLSLSGESWSRAPDPTSRDLRLLARLEQTGSLAINDLLDMDTLILRRRGRAYALRYFAVCAANLEVFLREQDVRAVFAEQTWGVELLAGLVCESLQIPFLKPHTVRIPAGRFGLFKGHLEQTLEQVGERSDEDIAHATRILEDFENRKPQPDYVATDREVLRLRRKRIADLYRHVAALRDDPWDETSRRPVGLMLDHGSQWLRKRVNRLLAPVTFRSRLDESVRPFVYFPLHLQPEASIDVKGRPYSNQLEVIRSIARTLPVTHELVVKEHPTALNRRSRRFYRELRAIPAIRLLDPRVPTFKLIDRADLTITVTGTAAYEAALLGRPAATIAPVFFDRIVSARRFDPYKDSVADLIANPRIPARQARLEFVADVLALSFPGTVGDAFWQPETMAPGNIDQVSSGIATWCDLHSSDPVPPQDV